MEKKRGTGERRRRREESRRREKGIESLNGSAERKEALETTAAAVVVVGDGREGGRGKNGIYSQRGERGQADEAHTRCTQRWGGGGGGLFEEKIALGE